MRVLEAVRVKQPPVTLPFCVFNGGRDTWLDVGNKRVGVEALQAFFGLAPSTCLHVGDQFLNTGNYPNPNPNYPNHNPNHNLTLTHSLTLTLT